MNKLLDKFQERPITYILIAGLIVFLVSNDSWITLTILLFILYGIYRVTASEQFQQIKKILQGRAGFKFNAENIFEQMGNRFTGQNINYTRARGGGLTLKQVITSLTAYVLNMNNTVKKSELNYVKRFLRNQFKDEEVKEILTNLKHLMGKNVNIRASLQTVDMRMTAQTRIDLFKYLIGIAQSNGQLSSHQRAALFNIGIEMGVPVQLIQQIFGYQSNYHNFHQRSNAGAGQKETYRQSVSPGDYYKVLGVSSSDDNEIIKKAYRKLSKKHHPDAGGNEEQFIKIQEAYEFIKDRRGIK